MNIYLLYLTSGKFVVLFIKVSFNASPIYSSIQVWFKMTCTISGLTAATSYLKMFLKITQKRVVTGKVFRSVYICTSGRTVTVSSLMLLVKETLVLSPRSPVSFLGLISRDLMKNLCPAIVSASSQSNLSM